MSKMPWRDKEPLRDIPDQNPQNDGREKAHTRHPRVCLRIVKANGDAPSVLYGALLGGPYYNPTHGIQMLFEGAHAVGWGEWLYGYWLVSIRGPNLQDVHNHLCNSTLEFIAEAEDGWEVSVTEYEMPVSKKMGKGRP